MRPRRSALFMPGNNIRAISKSKTLPCDVVILDLEDAVGSDKKHQSRETVRDSLLDGGFGSREIAVRVNALGTVFHADDLSAFRDVPLNAIVLPKAEHKHELKQLGEQMDLLGFNPEIELWLMAETPTGVLNIRELCNAHPRVNAVLLGTSDLGKCLQLPQDHQRTGLLHALSHCLLAAREAEINILDGVFLDLQSPELFEAQCKQGKILGFDGKILIHPSQIEKANDIFAPSNAEIIKARAIVKAWKVAIADGDGLCVLEGRLVENLHVEEAKRVLDLAHLIATQSF